MKMTEREVIDSLHLGKEMKRSAHVCPGMCRQPDALHVCGLYGVCGLDRHHLRRITEMGLSLSHWGTLSKIGLLKS